MNRAARRIAARVGRGQGGLPPLCAPGTHRFGEVRSTVAGAVTAVRVVCATCRRTFQQVMEESPQDLAMYRAFLEAEASKAEHTHPPGRRFKGCPGCERIAALEHSSPEALGADPARTAVRTAVKPSEEEPDRT